MHKHTWAKSKQNFLLNTAPAHNAASNELVGKINMNASVICIFYTTFDMASANRDTLPHVTSTSK